MHEADAANFERALSYALRFTSRGKPWRADFTLRDRKLTEPCRVAQRLVEHLRLSGYVIVGPAPCWRNWRH